MDSMGFPNQSFISKVGFGQSSSLVPLLKKVACSAGYIQGLALLNTLQTLDRCIQPSHEILYSPPHAKRGGFDGYKTYISFRRK